MRRDLRFGLLLFAVTVAALNTRASADPGCISCPEVAEGNDVCNPGDPLGEWYLTDERLVTDWEGRKWAESNGEICFHYTEYFDEYERSFTQDSGCQPYFHSEAQVESGIWERRLYGTVEDCCAAFGCD